MSNFIDKTFSVIADILIKMLPASKREKTAFYYYKTGMAAQNKGKYSKALKNYFEALQIEEDMYDRSYILYNIGLVYDNMDKKKEALEFYHQAIALNDCLPQAYYNIGRIYHEKALACSIINDDEHNLLASEFYDKTVEYWNRALKLAPNNYPNARNWLEGIARLDIDLK